MKDGGYAKGGAKVKAKREPEAVVRKEVALLRKAGAPKALVSHEVREMSGEMDTPATKRAEVGMMRKAKAPLTMIKEEMMEPVGLKKGGMAGCYAEGGQFAAGTRSKMDAEGKAARSAHGIRKSVGELLAMKGATQYEITAVHGHLSARTSEVYTRGYNRTILGEMAMNRMKDFEW